MRNQRASYRSHSLQNYLLFYQSEKSHALVNLLPFSQNALSLQELLNFSEYNANKWKVIYRFSSYTRVCYETSVRMSAVRVDWDRLSPVKVHQHIFYSPFFPHVDM